MSVLDLNIEHSTAKSSITGDSVLRKSSLKLEQYSIIDGRKKTTFVTHRITELDYRHSSDMHTLIYGDVREHLVELREALYSLQGVPRDTLLGIFTPLDAAFEATEPGEVT